MSRGSSRLGRDSPRPINASNHVPCFSIFTNKYLRMWTREHVTYVRNSSSTQQQKIDTQYSKSKRTLVSRTQLLHSLRLRRSLLLAKPSVPPKRLTTLTLATL